MSFHLLLTLKELSRAGSGDARVKLASPCPLPSLCCQAYWSDCHLSVNPVVGVAWHGVNPHHISAPGLPCNAEPSRSRPWKAKGCLGPSCLPSQASDWTWGMPSNPREGGNLQVIFGFHLFRNQGGRERTCVRSLMKSGTFQVNGVAIFWGVHFLFFAKFVFFAVNVIPKMPATFGFHSSQRDICLQTNKSESECAAW